MPRKNTPIPTPMSVGKPNELELTAVIPPAINNANPPMIHNPERTATRMRHI